MEYLIAFRSRPETASDVISCKVVGPIVLDKSLKFRDPCLNRSRQFCRYNFRSEVDNDIISSVAVDSYVCIDAHVKFGVGVTRSNASRLEILFEGLIMCRMNERANMT